MDSEPGRPGDTDWRSGKNVTQCNRYMLENQINCDVTFVVGTGEDKQQISAHKYMLICRSEVFDAMLFGLLHEQSNTIQIPDVSPFAFRKLLEFIYYDNTRIEEDDAYETLYVARKYLVTGLTQRCLQRLKARMSAKNVCLILSYADDQETVKRCLVYIYRYPKEVLKSDGFKELTLENVRTIVASNKFGVREEDIFDSLISWSERECQRRDLDILPENQYKVLGDTLQLIRYGRMDRNYVFHVCKKFLPPSVYSEIVENLASGIEIVKAREEQDSLEASSLHHPTRRRAHPPHTSCSAEARLYSPYHDSLDVVECHNGADGGSDVSSVFTRRRDILIIHRFDKHSFVAGKSYDMQTPDSISFIVSHRISLVAILFYGSCGEVGEYNIHLQILEDLGRTLSLMDSTEKVILTDGTTKHYKFNIRPSIQIESDRVYTISALIQGPPSYYGTNGRTNVRKNGVTVDFITRDDFDLNQTTAEVGQFPGLVFEQSV